MMAIIALLMPMANAGIYVPQASAVSAPTGVQSSLPEQEVTEVQKNILIEKAVNVPGIKNWSQTGWQYNTMSFYGNTNSSKWKTAVVYLKLPHGVGNSPVDCQQGWSAAVTIDLDTYEVKDAGFPTPSSHQCEPRVTLVDPDMIGKGSDIPSFIPTASAALAYYPDILEMLQTDVTSHNVYGGWVYLKTPTINSNIFSGSSHMTDYVGNTFNQKFYTTLGGGDQYFEQAGWLVTVPDACLSCGSEYIPAKSKDIVYVDKSSFGTAEPHKVNINYVDNSFALLEIRCGVGDTVYKIRVTHNGVAFSHLTQIACGTADNNSSRSNSMYLENANTATESWPSDITQSQMGAYSAREYRDSTSTLSTWLAMDKDEDNLCTGTITPNTPLISGSLAADGTATWINLSSMGHGCIK